MKKVALLILLLSFAFAISAQESNTAVQIENDSVFVDTLNKNLIGLNVYPAFGILGGGRTPNTKIFIQYKHYYDKMNLRASINYINFYRDYNNIDIVRMRSDSLVKPDTTIYADTLVMRQFYYDIYSYDARLGIEAAFPNKDFRFYVGGGLIAGYHYTGEYYYHYERAFTGYPVDYINVSPISSILETEGYRKTQFLKMGVDFTVGVDINISPNCIITVQYAPELVYYHNLKQDILDPDNYYTREIGSEVSFIPDYIDFIVNIRF